MTGNPYLAGGVALGVATVTLPLWRAVCRRVGLVDDPGPRKIHAAAVPLAGGLAVMTGAGAGIGMGWWQGGGLGWAVGVALLLALGLGVVDDAVELSPAPKLAGQFLVIGVLLAGGVRFPLGNPWVGGAVTFVWLLAVLNALNVMDNMNGLCAGFGAIASAGFGALALRSGQEDAALLGFALAGAALGFLPFNYPRATAFLGDAGSHVFGVALGIQGVWACAGAGMKGGGRTALLLLLVPLADLAWVMWLRARRGLPVWKGDNQHLSHRLVARGWSAPGAVALIWALGLATAALALFLG